MFGMIVYAVKINHRKKVSLGKYCRAIGGYMLVISERCQQNNGREIRRKNIFSHKSIEKNVCIIYA
jgi:hypothetical protein